MSNQLFAVFIKWVLTYHPGAKERIDEIVPDMRAVLNDSDTIEQQALNYFIDQYDSITQS